jgi:quaternary ammonium compound-resistance protein SugE
LISGSCRGRSSPVLVAPAGTGHPTFDRRAEGEPSRRPNVAWLCLFLAGLFEIGFTTFLKLADGFSRLWPTVFFVQFALASLWLLNKALQGVPLGTAYAVWTGIGAFGTAVVGILMFADPVTFWRLFFLALLIGSIIGLKVVSPDP